MQNSEGRIQKAEGARAAWQRAFSILSSQFSIGSIGSIGSIVVVFIALCLINNAVLPVFEASDEAAHFRYADYLASERHLPDLNQALPSHEATQPVLYYLAIALAIAPFDRSQLPEISHLNPDWFDRILNADYKSVRPLYLHTPQEDWPWSSVVWAVRVGRLVSTVLGALTIFFVYKTALEVRGQASGVTSHESYHFQLSTFNFQPNSALSTKHLALFAAALVAFNPKFIHMSSIVNNDGAVTLAATVTCWWMMRIIRRQWEVESQKSSVNKPLFMLGIFVGIAALCKLSGIALLLPAAVVALFAPRPTPHAPRSTLHPPRLLPLLCGFILSAGPWFVFNQINYGNPLAWAQVQAANAALQRVPPLGLSDILARIPQVFESYWGVLGIELHYPDWVNAVFYIGMAFAIAGCVRRVKRQTACPELVEGSHVKPMAWVDHFQLSTFNFQLATLLLWELALLGSFGLWLRSYVGTENGRLILPGIAPIALLVAWGWMALLPAKWQRGVAMLVSASLLTLCAITPFWIIHPAFAPPPAISTAERADLPAQPTLLLNGKLQLWHAALGKRVNQNGPLPISLDWSTRDKIDQSYQVDLRVVALDGTVLGQLRVLPYHGQYATTQWTPGHIFNDDYLIPIQPITHSQAIVARVELRLFRRYPEAGFVLLQDQNEALILGRARFTPNQPQPTAPAPTPIATFGELLALERATLTDNNLALRWRCVTTPDKDYTLFIHLFDADNKLIAQFDGQPYNGEYPTHLCASGDTINDTRQITVPPSATRIQIGWYDAVSGQRLAATHPDGSRWPDDSVLIWERKP